MTKNDFIETINYSGGESKFYSLRKVSEKFSFDLDLMPYSLRILLENLVLLNSLCHIQSKQSDAVGQL